MIKQPCGEVVTQIETQIAKASGDDNEAHDTSNASEPAAKKSKASNKIDAMQWVCPKCNAKNQISTEQCKCGHSIATAIVEAVAEFDAENARKKDMVPLTPSPDTPAEGQEEDADFMCDTWKCTECGALNDSAVTKCGQCEDGTGANGKKLATIQEEEDTTVPNPNAPQEASHENTSPTLSQPATSSCSEAGDQKENTCK